jgi:cob(I)alamin adenosyltransferase
MTQPHIKAKGLTIIFTGEGKGKTSAAMGTALRAAGYKRRVLVLQFVKMWFTGEKEGFKGLEPFVEFLQMGEGFVQIMGDQKDPEVHKQAALAALAVARERMQSGNYDLVVLDEIIGSEVGGLIPAGSCVDLIKTKPEALDLVLTGRHAETLTGLIELADTVTEMVKVKHPYDAGILAKKGIDF